jgi:hypothetical protein
MHDPRHAGEHPTVAFGRLRGEQVHFFTHTELGLLLSRLLLGVTRHDRTLAIGGSASPFARQRESSTADTSDTTWISSIPSARSAT